MRLTHGTGDGVILYDDHGEEWRVTLDRSGVPPGDAPGEDREFDGPGTAPQRILRFQSAKDDPIDVPYEGDAERTTDLSLGDVVEHFLQATE